MESDLLRLLEAREERQRWQRELLAEFPVLVQVMLNLPGVPKNIPGDRAVLEQVALRLCGATKAQRNPDRQVFLRNEAGAVVLLAFRGVSVESLKRRCMELEEKMPEGRALDIDVIVPGGALKRQEFGVPPRRCLLCGDEAKVCARLGRHDVEELRKRVLRLLFRGEKAAAED